MNKIDRRPVKAPMAGLFVVVLFLMIGAVSPLRALADEADAKRLLKAMADYMEAQKAISFDYDAVLEIVTVEGQRLSLASSGTMSLKRPDKIRATRSGGFADVEMIFDGKTLTLFGKIANLYTQVEVPGTIDNLVTELRDTYNRPLPGADFIISDIYDELMNGVTDIKDLGSGVVNGVECDSLAFRTDDVDWQIWIAHGDRPYPCRYSITSKLIAGGPQYSFQVRDWKTGSQVAADDFAFKNASNATKVDLKNLRGTAELPENFKKGVAK